jgi:hypothetical protein
MATNAQITANRANAQHSTGPVTSEGKSRVAQNALRHGLTARRLVVRDDEREDFDALSASLLEELAPQGALENLTFEELLHAAWNLRRFRRIETEASLGTLDDFTDSQTAAVLDRLGRYQARAQRAYYRALHELRTLQTNRGLREQKLDPETAAAVPALAGIGDLTKQTQSDVTAEAIQQASRILNLETGLLRVDAFRRLYAAAAPAPPAMAK